MNFAMNTKLKQLLMRIVLMGVMELVCVGALVWACMNENIDMVTITCLAGAFIHTRLAPNQKELALLTGKKS